jgi:two-component system, sensor histidine kinase
MIEASHISALDAARSPARQPTSAVPSPLGWHPRIYPRREALGAAATIFAVSALGVFVTYYFARQAQLEAVRNELSQLGRVVAASIDGDLHTSAAGLGMAGSPEYLKALQPIVRFHRATEDVIYVYTYMLRDGAVRFGLDSAFLYKVPGDTEDYDPPMKVYDGNDPDARRALETHALTVNDEPTVEAVRSYLSAYAPFFDSHGEFVGVVGVDMWVRHLDERLARLQRIATAAAVVLMLLSTATGVLVFRLRTTAAQAAARDHQAVIDLAAAKDAAEQSSRAKSAFLAMMSHELRTPLNAIVGYSELIQDEMHDRGDAALANDVGRVVQASRHLTSIIGDILDYSKLEVGRLELVPSTVDLAAMVRELAELMKTGASDKGLVLAVDVHPSVTAVYGDPVRIRQVLLNLIGNALKFTDQGRVTVRLRPSPNLNGHLVCAVHDTGTGVPADRQAKLFEPFSQVDSSPTTLTMRSRAHCGSTFRFSFPAAAG